MSSLKAFTAVRAARQYALARDYVRSVATGVGIVEPSKSTSPDAGAPPRKLPSEHRFRPTMTVAHLLGDRNDIVYSVKKDATVLDAVKMMVKHNIGSLVVVSDENKVESVVSERDYMEKVMIRGRTSVNTRVKDIMSEKSLVTVRPDSTLTECMELMTANKVRHIPVVTVDGTPAGMVSIGDTVKALVDSYRRDAEHMEDFISGNTY